MYVQSYRTELDALLSTKNENMRQALRENPTETIIDLEDPDLANLKVYRLKFKGRNNSEIYVEVGQRLYDHIQGQQTKDLSFLRQAMQISDYFRTL